MSITKQELAASDLFKGVSDEILSEVLAQAEPRELEAGEVLLSPDRENGHLFLLLSGSVSIHFSAPDTPVIRVIHSGNSVGELSVIMDTQPSAYVVVEEACRVLPLERTLVWRLVDRDKTVSRNLLTILARWILSNTDKIVEDREHIQELSHNVSVDRLTGLFNRYWLEQALPDLLSRSQKADKPLCLLMLDVDHFKKFNDAHGHLAGDQALVEVGNNFRAQLRPTDFAVRYGGEEFLILLPDTTLDEGAAIAGRLMNTQERRPIATPDGTSLPSITLSIGIAVSDGDSDPISLVKTADTLLYQAKSEGRNRCRH